MSSSVACSSRHSTHQVPQTFSTHGLPASSRDETLRPGSPSTGSSNAGAGLPSRADSHRALVRRMPTPMYNTLASATNTRTGTRKRFKWPRPCRRGAVGGLGGLLPRTITTVAGGQRSAERHESRRQPDVVDQRPQLRANAPAASAEVFTQRREQIHVPARIDAGLGHGRALHPVVALFGMQHGDRLSVTQHRDLARARHRS